MSSVSVSPTALMAIIPMMIVAATILCVMIGIALKRSAKLSMLVSMLGLGLAFFWTILQLFGVVSFESNLGNLLAIDGFALFGSVVVLVSSLICTSYIYEYFESFKDNKEELYLLVLTATLGGMVLTASEHFASFFMGLELLSVPMYGMLGYTFLRKKSLESALKYLILSAAASATLLLGMAFVFAGVGSLSFGEIGNKLTIIVSLPSFLVVGTTLMCAAVAFKLSLAPFHAWVGDVYQGAVSPVVAFLASASKVAAVAVFVRFLVKSATPILPSIDSVLTVMVVMSVLVGNLLALRQNSIKRLLAYSSIAHMGYVLIILISQGAVADTTISTYMVVYALTSLGSFGVLVLMTGSVGRKEADDINYYRGLFWRRPVLSGVLTLMLLSLAGIPLTAGFITKMQVMMSAVEGGRFGLAAMLVVGSAIGLYYYLKMVLMLYKRPAQRVVFDVANNWRVKINGLIVIVIAAIIVLWGVLPSLMLNLTKLAMIE